MRKPSVAALVAILFAGSSSVAIAAGGFVDVPAGHTFADDIAWLADQGITRGCNPPTNDRFCPDDYVTRAQMSAFMRRFASSDAIQGAQGTAGPAGPAGPVGPAGPAGPGPLVVEFDVPQTVGPVDVVVEVADGLEILAICSSVQNFVVLRGPDFTNLRFAGLFTDQDGRAIAGRVANGWPQTGRTPGGPVQLSGLVESLAVGVSYQVEVHMSWGDPCNVWGSVIPLG